MMLFVFPASAAEMPRFDVVAHCKQVSAFGGSYSESLNESCMDMEQSAYNQIKAAWANLSTSMQNHCKQVASFAGAGSYSLLQGCIDMELNAAKNNKYRQFKY